MGFNERSPGHSSPPIISTPTQDTDVTPKKSGSFFRTLKNKAFHRHRGSFDTTVDIKVGPNKKLFKIHKQLLCDTSPYFEAALKGRFKEAQDQSIEFADEDARMFEYFQLWLYSGTILASDEAAEDVHFSTLYDLYLFGEMRSVSGLQDAAIDLFIDRSAKEAVIPHTLLSGVYENLPDGSPLRRLFVDWFSYDLHQDYETWFSSSDSDTAAYPHDFLCDLIKSLYAIQCGTKSKTLDIPENRANYHVTSRTRSKINTKPIMAQ